MLKRPFTLLIHIALVIIVAGACVTHFFGIQGKVTLAEGSPTDRFEKLSGPGVGSFPFTVLLDTVEISYYPGTTTPMDFASRLRIGGEPVSVSMNKVGGMSGWRFYQTGIGPDSSTLSVSYDPWGIGLTYAGYLLLGIGMVGFFFQRNTPWRALLRNVRKGVMLIALIGGCSSAVASDLPVMQRPLAANLGKVCVYWNDRVCPMQTMAYDVTAALYGSASYEGYTPEQVLSGWLFYFDAWERDFMEKHPAPEGDSSSRKNRKLSEQFALIRQLGTGEAFRIYPYKSAQGNLEWLSLTGRRPSQMSLEQWTFMQTTMPHVKELLMMGRNRAANDVLTELMAGQEKYAGAGVLPSTAKMEAERIFNRFARPGWGAVAALLLAIFFIMHALRPGNNSRRFIPVARFMVWLTLLYVVLLMSSIWWISGHLPLTNGPETMMFMALAALIGCCFTGSQLINGCLLAVAAVSLGVAAMAGRTPRMEALMPVLGSPLLSVHVMIVMCSYVLFLLMALLSGIALSSSDEARKEHLSAINRLLLTPAVCLLAAGIFIGAVWANQSWGRYWGWDPKETCALVMLLVYSVPMHWGCRRLSCFRRHKVLHLYLLAAVFTVAFTYFGANYLLPGLHSYA